MVQVMSSSFVFEMEGVSNSASNFAWMSYPSRLGASKQSHQPLFGEKESHSDDASVVETARCSKFQVKSTGMEVVASKFYWLKESTAKPLSKRVYGQVSFWTNLG